MARAPAALRLLVPRAAARTAAQPGSRACAAAALSTRPRLDSTWLHGVKLGLQLAVVADGRAEILEDRALEITVGPTEQRDNGLIGAILFLEPLPVHKKAQAI